MRSRRVAFERWVIGPDLIARPSRATVVVGLVIAVTGAIVAFLRLPPGSRDVSWAEDGSVFVTGALSPRPFLATMFTPYNGYMHAFPRVFTAIVVGAVPLADVPIGLAVVACALTGLIAGLAFVLLAPRVPGRIARGAMSVGLVTIPLAGFEVNGSVANSHWYLLVGLFVVLVTRQRGLATTIIACAVVAFSALSDPLSAVFLPFALVGFLRPRRGQQLPALVTYLVALAIQMTIVVRAHDAAQPASAEVAGVLRALGYRVFLASLAGASGAFFLFEMIGTAVLIVAAVIVIGLVAANIGWAPRTSGLAVGAVSASIVFFLVAVVVRWLPVYDPAVSAEWGASRYSVVPCALLVVAFASAADSWRQLAWTRQPVALAVPVALLVVLLALAVPDFGKTDRHPTIAWSTAVSRAEVSCKREPAKRTVAIAGDPSAFTVNATCTEVLAHAGNR